MVGKQSGATRAAAALTKFQEKFEKSYGEGTIAIAGEIVPYEVISTGSIALDYALGVGGYVEGRLVEIWGPDGIGKTTLTMITVVEAQKKHPDKMVAWLDMEHKLDKQWARDHGIDLNRFMLITSNSAEEVADQVKDLVRSGLCSMVVIDSIGGMIPEVEIEKAAGDATMGLQAKIVTRMVKIAAVEADKNGTVVIFINQVRANLSYGGNQTTGGGYALRHSTTHKLRLRRSSRTPFSLTQDGESIEVGHEVAIKVERNGVAPPHKIANVSLFNQTTAKFGAVGVDRADEAVTIGIRAKVITQGGAWFTLPTGEKYNGREKLLEALRTQPGVVDDIRRRVLDSIADTVYDEEQVDEVPVSNGDGLALRTGIEDRDE